MQNFNGVKKIFVCAVDYRFTGGIDAYQIRIYAHFSDEEVMNSMFVFCSHNKKQIKIYEENEKYVSLTQYRVRKGTFNFPEKDGNYYKIDKKQLEWILNGINQIKEEQKYKKAE